MSHRDRMRRYVEPNGLHLEPLEVIGREGCYVDRSTFTRRDGSPHPIFVMTDDKGRFYIPEEPLSLRLPKGIDDHVIEYRLTAFLDRSHGLEYRRSFDPLNRNWSVHISPKQGHHKVTIFARTYGKTKFLLDLLQRGAYQDYYDGRHAQSREQKRQRGRRPDKRGRNRRPYRRPTAAHVRQLVEDELTEAA